MDLLANIPMDNNAISMDKVTHSRLAAAGVSYPPGFTHCLFPGIDFHKKNL
jgi:hypothetical protein